MNMEEETKKKTGLLALSISALGVVYGDIGTSPLYAMKETFFGTHPLARNTENVLGILSLVFWTILLIVGIKYVLLVLRADFHGEGGIFALLGIIRSRQPQNGNSGRLMSVITVAVMIGAAALYGDAVITPAISVLSAYEGLEVVTSAFKPAIIWITVITLLVLFLFQRHGTSRVGGTFGPIMVIWFITIGAVGLFWIAIHPIVLLAVNPLYAWRFFMAHGIRIIFVLGAVVLTITGAEALYADVGHFGRKVIQRSWYSFVFPCLLLNYFGQGARLLDAAPVVNNHLFYALFPQQDGIIYSVVILSTMATVIASQALISGAFSMTRQGVALGFFPRMLVRFTSAEIEGQIYIPAVNWLLLGGCIALVMGFQTSSALAAAYGIAVTATMAITSFIFYFVARSWGWNRFWIGPVCLVFILDRSFLFFRQYSQICQRRLCSDHDRHFPFLSHAILAVGTSAIGKRLLRIPEDPDPALRGIEATDHGQPHAAHPVWHAKPHPGGKGDRLHDIAPRPVGG